MDRSRTDNYVAMPQWVPQDGESFFYWSSPERRVHYFSRSESSRVFTDLQGWSQKSVASRVLLLPGQQGASVDRQVGECGISELNSKVQNQVDCLPQHWGRGVKETSVMDSVQILLVHLRNNHITPSEFPTWTRTSIIMSKSVALDSFRFSSTSVLWTTLERFSLRPLDTRSDHLDMKYPWTVVVKYRSQERRSCNLCSLLPRGREKS